MTVMQDQEDDSLASHTGAQIKKITHWSTDEVPYHLQLKIVCASQGSTTKRQMHNQEAVGMKEEHKTGAKSGSYRDEERL